MQIKHRKADIMYSEWLRRERPACERCYKTQSLQCSHFFGRANENLRFNPANTDCLCFSCHQFFTANPNEYVEWKRKRMGEIEYKRLVIEANVKRKRDDKIIILWLMKELQMDEPKKEREPRICSCRIKYPHCGLHHIKPKKKKITSSSSSE